MLGRRLLVDLSPSQLVICGMRFYQKDVAVIGYPYGGGQARQDVEHTPRLFREMGLIDTIRGMGRNVTDYGDCKVGDEFVFFLFDIES